MPKAIFIEGNLMRHVVTMSFTSSVGIMAIFAVDFIDMLFISMLGNDALAAAVGYAGTLLFFTNAINIGVSIAAGTLVARSLGAENYQNARQYATNVAILGAMIGVIVPIVVWSFVPDLLQLLGAKGEPLRLALGYLRIILPSMAFMALAMTSMAILRAYGDAKRSMLATLWGGVVNAILDPLFIFGFGWELEGAAIASVVARITIFFFSIMPLLRLHRAFAMPSMRLAHRDGFEIAGLAIPAMLTNVATPVGMAIVTREIAQFGTDAVAGMAVIGRLTPLAFAMILALSGAIGPIIGQNFGAKKIRRVLGSYHAAIAFAAMYVVVVTCILLFFRDYIIALFDVKGIGRDMLALFCGPLALASFFNAVIFVSNACFNNLGHSLYSTWINWGRHTLGTWPLALLGAFWLGAEGVLLGQAAGGLIFAALSFVLSHYLIRNLGIDSIQKSSTQYAHEHHAHAHHVHGRERW